MKNKNIKKDLEGRKRSQCVMEFSGKFYVQEWNLLKNELIKAQVGVGVFEKEYHREGTTVGSATKDSIGCDGTINTTPILQAKLKNREEPRK